ncbi:transporter [Duganella sp. FT92W]|uniref:Transporter n=1 Tax=Pseudoduganella rivuli TaxID=2666085 RepID=A0A7X2IKY5_9BURK|nr:transporter [Pseudoduganella rivuli]MRV71755.1 transporter [Pseudoduganella rivuli]
MRRTVFQSMVATLLAALASTPAMALDVDAGDYTALPPGTNLALVYYQHAQRDRLYGKGAPVPIVAGLDSDVGILRGVHFMDIGGITVDPQFLLPFGRLKGKDGTAFLGDGSGAGDVILAATAWLVNRKDANTYFGITPFLTLPTGRYDRNKALNLGEHRTKFTLQAGYITPVAPSLSLDLIADVTVYGDNRDFGAASATLAQKASYGAQAHLRYHVSPTMDVRAGVFKTITGETRVNGVGRGDRGDTVKFNLGATYFVRPTTQLLATWGRDTSVRDGFKENSRVNLRLLEVF